MYNNLSWLCLCYFVNCKSMKKFTLKRYYSEINIKYDHSAHSNNGNMSAMN